MKNEWKDIASAPKDGSFLFLFGFSPSVGFNVMTIGSYDGKDWVDRVDDRIMPTHWRELRSFPYDFYLDPDSPCSPVDGMRGDGG